jgi:hypothetical protein
MREVKMRKALMALALALVATGAEAQITLGETQAEVDAWAAPRLGDWGTAFADCVAAQQLNQCHPAPSSTVLPNTAPTDSSAAVVTNNDPGVFAPNICDPNCYDDTRGTWAAAFVDIPATGPAQLQANSFEAPGGAISIQLITRIQYDGTIYERAYSVVGSAPTFGWQEVPSTP